MQLKPVPVTDPKAADMAESVLGMVCNPRRGATDSDKAWAIEYVVAQHAPDPYKPTYPPEFVLEVIHHILTVPTRGEC